MARTITNNLRVLLAKKSQAEGRTRTLSLRKAAAETGIKPYTLYALANDTLREYPKNVLETLLAYFDCDLTELLVTREDGIAGDNANGES